MFPLRFSFILSSIMSIIKKNALSFSFHNLYYGLKQTLNELTILQAVEAAMIPSHAQVQVMPPTVVAVSSSNKFS